MPHDDLSRRSFMAASAVLGLTAVSRAQPAEPEPQAAAAPSPFPQQTPELVQAVVGAAHTSLAKVQELVEKCPPLARAGWDWGFGDWETALGAATHTGQREIADYLIRRGARPDIFTFAMFGHLDTVKAMIAARPGIQRIPGPHGIPLLQHARAGGPLAADVLRYLESLGDAGIEPQDHTIPPEQLPGFLGTFKLEGEPDVTFVLKSVKGKVAIQRGQQPHRMLIYHTAYEFSPAGALEVRLHFEFKDNKAVAITGRNHVADFRAVRIEE